MKTRTGTTNFNLTDTAIDRTVVMPVDQSEGPSEPRVVLSSPTGPNLSSQHKAGPSTNKANSEHNFLPHLRKLDDQMADLLSLTKRKHDEQQSDDQANPKKRMRTDDEDSFQDSGSESNHPAVCKPCRAQKKGCEETRPCSRCVKSGKQELCIPTVAKHKRRPRYKEKAERPKVDAEMTQRNAGAEPQVPKPRRQEPVSRANIEAPVNQQTIRHPQDPRSRKPRPSPTLAPSTAQNAHTATTRPAYTNPMIAPPLTSLPRLIRGRGRCVYIIDLRDLIKDHQTVAQVATQNQHNLIQLRDNNPPAAGHWPQVLLDSDWSDKTTALPWHVNCLVHIPDTEYGDFWGLFAAPTRKTQGMREGIPHVERPQDGRTLWACLSKDLIDAMKYHNRAFRSIQHKEKPMFLPGTVGFQTWIEAAETWVSEYELPVEEEYLCCCRRRRKDCMVKDLSMLAIGNVMVRDSEGKYSVQPRLIEEKTIQCQAGERCGQREYHLSCLGIPLEKQEGIWLDAEWWCPVCRVQYPHEARNGVILDGERLELRKRVNEPPVAGLA